MLMSHPDVDTLHPQLLMNRAKTREQEYMTTKTESFCIAFASVGIALHIGAPCNVATKVGTKSVLHQVQMRFGTLSNGCIEKSISLPWHRNLMINFHPTRHWNVPEDNDSRSQSC